MSESILCAKCGYTVANDIELPTTPVPDLLGGHYIPSEFQAKMICDTISTAQADISRLDDEITRLNAVLDQEVCNNRYRDIGWGGGGGVTRA
jgi:hypothetical protein